MSIPFPPKNVRSNAKKRRKEHKNNRWAGFSAMKEAVGTWLGQDKLPVCQPGRKRATLWNFGRWEPTEVFNITVFMING